MESGQTDNSTWVAFLFRGDQEKGWFSCRIELVTSFIYVHKESPVRPSVSPILPFNKESAYEVFGKYMWTESFQKRNYTDENSICRVKASPTPRPTPCKLRSRSRTQIPYTTKKLELSSPQMSLPPPEFMKDLVLKNRSYSARIPSFSRIPSPGPLSSNGTSRPRHLWLPPDYESHVKGKERAQ